MIIKNEQQYRHTQNWLQKFEQSIAELDNNESLKSEELRWKLYRDSYQSKADELREQIAEYETLINHDSQTPLVIELNDTNSIPDILIKARIAAKLSHKELADLAGLQETQIQQYEDKDYETASFLDVMAVFEALELKIQHCEFLLPLDTLRRTPITKEKLLSRQLKNATPAGGT